MKKIYLLILFFASLSAFSQDTIVRGNKIKIITSASVKNVASSSDKKNTLFYTFGIWCEPCRLHLPTAIKLAKDYDLDFYVIVVDALSSDNAIKAFDYLSQLDKGIKLAVLSDNEYGIKTKKRNTKFVSEITPAGFENIDDFSKYILLNQQGEVIMVTNYKDNQGNDWRDDSKMVEKRIVPLLK
ncbi:hypothetical protein OGH69_02895 [Flavobacterium sp. MFBS3-15]|uniref:TlpA family protein disulfide reductase n=1 Tax=Flavobacterium sp. MFBS3-15 TaxID=2989816 RepID=UPI0022359ACC|nr:hypothetical protein [Flavobacterium sp. MFBS3-15]MCW4467900.1 hypothetical protein [Flavobacterium sp. MFBS3-15]